MRTAGGCRQGCTNTATAGQERMPHRERLDLHTDCLVLLAEVAEILLQAGQVLQVAHSSIDHQHHLQEHRGRMTLTARLCCPPRETKSLTLLLHPSQPDHLPAQQMPSELSFALLQSICHISEAYCSSTHHILPWDTARRATASSTADLPVPEGVKQSYSRAVMG